MGKCDPQSFMCCGVGAQSGGIRKSCIFQVVGHSGKSLSHRLLLPEENIDPLELVLVIMNSYKDPSPCPGSLSCFLSSHVSAATNTCSSTHYGCLAWAVLHWLNTQLPNYELKRALCFGFIKETQLRCFSVVMQNGVIRGLYSKVSLDCHHSTVIFTISSKLEVFNLGTHIAQGWIYQLVKGNWLRYYWNLRNSS